MSIQLDPWPPDFNELERVITGRTAPRRVHFVELGIDGEVWNHLEQHIFQRESASQPSSQGNYVHRLIDGYAHLGYDYVHIGCPMRNLPVFKERRTADSAALSRGERSWVEEGGGIIKNWEDFERIDWAGIAPDWSILDDVARHLPQGMKVTIGSTVFEMILERFLGYEDLFMLSVDNPDLVAKIFEAWGQKVYEAYEKAIGHPSVGAIFHADDLGYKTGTMLSPSFLRQHVFPWFRSYAELAHKHGKTYWYHCCGNVLEVMDDLLDDVGIDAFHSFQDVIIPIPQFTKRYGHRVAALGGIDMDKLARLDETQFRNYVRDTLSECMPGRFALGSGNTVANYIPPANYLAMIEEGHNWRPHTGT